MNKVQEAIKILNDDGIVIFPTDTAFGIGCRIDKEDGIKKLFSIRKRPTSQATPVLCDSIEMVREYVLEIPKDVQSLMKKHWPGALTIVLNCKIDKVPDLVRGGGSTIGVRIPNHEITLELIKGVDAPILGPSANFHGERTPYLFQDLNPELTKLADFVIPGETKYGEASTVIDCSVYPWKILRKGAVKL